LEVRAAAWTGKLVTKVCAMDRVSDSQFGKLQLKPEYSCATLIPPQRIHQFIDSNMPESLTVNWDVLKSALSEFSMAINHAVLNLALNLRQGVQ